MQSASHADLICAFRRVAQNRGWHLLAFPQAGVSETDIATAMQNYLDEQGAASRSGVTRDPIESAAVAAYCPVLYAALNSPHKDIQTQALREIWAYIAPIAQREFKDDGEAGAVANRALAIIWQNRARVRTPVAFLSWCAMITVNEVRHELRRQGRAREVPLEAEGEQPDEREGFRSQSAVEQPALAEAALVNEGGYKKVEQQMTLADLERLIRRCLRSELQQEVAVRVLLNDLDAEEVAEQLDITTAYLYVLSFRAKKRLQQCHVLLEALGVAVQAEAGRQRHAA